MMTQPMLSPVSSVPPLGASPSGPAIWAGAISAGEHSDAQQALYRKILWVQKAVDAVPKRGFNAFHKYHYATEADILTMKAVLNEQGLIVLPTTVATQTGFKPDGKSWASVTLLFRVIDSASGEAIESQFTGYAEDHFDKAIYKATTGANKYFYLKFFGLATEDDPEREEGSGGGSLSSGAPSVQSAERAKPTGTTPDPWETGRSTLKRMKKTSASTVQGEIGLETAAGARQPVVSSVEKAGIQEAEAAIGKKTVEKSTGAHRLGEPKPLTRKQEALAVANQILALQKQAELSNEAVLRHGEIESVKKLAENGDLEKLLQAYAKLEAYCQK